ncbi:MAG: ABC transporter substrate-binding protein [SAR202 cluster bacterium]|nr:ABC transporter substrate-binding protein [SAR202 cluster bacterium]
MRFPRWSSRLSLFSVLALFSLFTLLIVGCGDDETPTATTRPGVTASPTATATATSRPSPTNTPTSAPKVAVESRLKVAIPTPSFQVTMVHLMNQISARIMPQYDYLVGHHHQTNEEMPQLARGWTMGPDGKAFNFKLRSGIPYYRDGKPIPGMTMTAKDVILAFGLAAGKDSQKTVQVRPEFGGKVDADIVDDQELNLRLAFPSPDLLFLISDEYAVGVVSKDHWDKTGGEEGYQKDPIGNGPWSMVELKTNEYVLHKRNENHYRKTPDFAEAQFLFVKEAATRLGMIINKEAHIVSVPRGIQQQAKDAGMVVYKSTLPAVHVQLRFSWFKPENYIDPATGKRPTGAKDQGTTVRGYDPNDPLRKLEVRKAINLAIDRDKINKTFYKGEGFPEVDYFPPWRNDFKDEWAPIPGPEGKTGKAGGWPYPYDPATAKQLISALYPQRMKTTIVVGNNQDVNQEQPDVAEAIAGMLKEVGIDVTLDAKPVADVLEMWSQRDRANTSYLISPSLDPACVVPTFIWWKGARGVQDFDEIVKLKEDCDKTMDPEARRKLAQGFGDWWVKNYISAPIVWLFADATVNPAVVQEYKVNMLHMGPVRYHEYTKPVLK